MFKNHIRHGKTNAELAIAYAVATPGTRSRLSSMHRQAAYGHGLDAVEQDEIHIELPPTAEMRALSGSIGASGEFATPEASFVATWELVLSALPMRAAATVERLDDGGGTFREPTATDATEGVIIAENQPAPSTQDTTFGLILHRPIKYGSGRLLVPAELPESAGLSFSAQLARVLGLRVSRIQNRSFTTGSGQNDSVGIIPACVQAGATVTAASPTTVAPDDLFALYDKLGSGYFDFEKCSCMMHKDVLLTLRRAKDGSGRPIFKFDNGRLDGFRVLLNDHCPSTIASGTAGSVLFGDFSFYHIKDWRTVRLVRFAEPHAETDQELWAAYQRSSGNLVDAGSHPVVSLVH